MLVLNRWLLAGILFLSLPLFARQDDVLISKESHHRRGPRGPRGHRGARGARGPFGHDGQRGPHGHIGNRGHLGYQGHRGHKGAAGQAGVAGATGPTGAQGATGPSALGSTIPGVDLIFTFTTLQDPSASASGRWQFFVVRPDFSQVPGPIVNIRDPNTTYAVTVPGPFFFGIYTGVLYNIDMQNTTNSSVLQGDMLVTTNIPSPAHTHIFVGGSDISDGIGAIVESMIQGFAIVPPF